MLLMWLLTFFSIGVAYFYYKNQRRRELSAKLPGPKTLPILGNIHLLGSEPHEIFNNVTNLCLEYRDMFRLYMLHEMGIFITGVKEVETILSSSKFIDKGRIYTFIEAWLGTGLLISTGKKWHSRRKAITPTFHFKILEQFIPVFDEQSGILVEKLEKYSKSQEEFDIFPYITRCAMDIICESAMGTSVNAQSEDSEYVKAVKDICRVIHDRIFSPLGPFHWTFVFTPGYWKQRQALKILHHQTNTVIASRKKELLNTEQKEEEDDFGRKKKMAFLDLLLQTKIDGKPLSDESIREEVDTFMFEGHDTTTSGISFALFNLAENPDVQEKLFQELRDIFGDDKTRPATYADFQNMKYLDLVIKETLRTHPPVPIISRWLTEEIELNGYTIPAETDVSINIYCMNHRPDVFPNPEKFDPERFSAENLAKHPYAYVPFSAGPRNCIGQKFAIMEMKSTISKVIRSYELVSSGHKPRLAVELILRSMNGVGLKIKPRKY